MKFFLSSTVISIVVFAFCWLATYLLSKEGEYNFKIGFPYKFYEQFKTSDGELWGWTPINLFKNIVLTWIISVSGYFVWLRKGINLKTISRK